MHHAMHLDKTWLLDSKKIPTTMAKCGAFLCRKFFDYYHWGEMTNG